MANNYITGTRFTLENRIHSNLYNLSDYNLYKTETGLYPTAFLDERNKWNEELMHQYYIFSGVSHPNSQ